jgi:hypothetical protein
MTAAAEISAITSALLKKPTNEPVAAPGKENPEEASSSCDTFSINRQKIPAAFQCHHCLPKKIGNP